MLVIVGAFSDRSKFLSKLLNRIVILFSQSLLAAVRGFRKRDQEGQVINQILHIFNWEYESPGGLT